jgi:outer membrane murein-binding lipoprotein Lpp
MNEEKYNNQELTAYLLGTLPDTEIERFDELCFTDEEFADELKSAENDLVDAYIRGELAGAKLEKFKSHYLASPLRREKVSFAKAFQSFAEKNAPEANIEQSAVHELKPERAERSFFAFPYSFLNWGFALALVLIVLGGLWILISHLNENGNQTAKQNSPAQTNQELTRKIEKLETENSNLNSEIAAIKQENQSTNSEMNQSKKEKFVDSSRKTKQEKPPIVAPKLSIVSLILAPSMRSVGQVPDFSVPPQTDFAQVKLQLEAVDYSAYRVLLFDQTDKNVWQSGVLKSKGADKSLSVRIPAKLLKAQIYYLRISGVDTGGAAEIISDYPFKVVR